ncbi:type II secretion system protein GspL [Melaminivora sp.]|uniref:type II secretion system protein GspL n=1 Tax=Melaminivora sp. TaxID=1933032 RepID=UPI0028A84CF1|nr:type II secretion system protein GspL [Melaminivora sp.]
MSILAILLPPAPSGVADSLDYVLSSDGQGVTRHGSASAALLPDPGRAGETVAVVPARALSWQRVALPPGALAQAARVRPVLEGLLEEHLLDEPAALHLALEPGAQSGNAAWVAVCDRAWLRAALAALEAAGHPADRVVPECAPGPTASGQPECSVLGTPEDAQLLLTGLAPTQAVAVLPASAAATAQALLGPAPEDGPPVRAEPAVVALAERLLAPRPVRLQTTAERALAATRGPWDLAQFDLASSGRTRALRRLAGAAHAFLRVPQWRAARWALALLLAVQVLGLNLWAWQDRQALAAKRAGSDLLLTETFPQVRVVVDAPVQMERELARLRQQSGSVSARDLEPLMAAAASALPPSTSPAALDYQEGELRLRGASLAESELPALRQRAAAAGASLNLQGDILVLRPAAQSGS